jgi:two-component system, NarL family, sensor kinase
MRQAPRFEARVGRAAAAAAVVVTVGSWALGTVLAAADGDLVQAVPGLGAVMFTAVGALVVWQRPGNRLGPLFCAGGLLLTVLGAGSLYAQHAASHPGGLPGGVPVSWVADLAALPSVGLLAAVIPQLFPDGRALSRRWRPALWAAWAFIVFATIGNAFSAQELESVPGRQNPYAVPELGALWSAMIALSVPLGLVALVAGLAALVLRWRRSTGDDRQQLKWFLVGAALLPVPLLLHDAAPTASDLVLSLAFVAIPVLLGVAVLRYRLYDLDLVVRRTAAYAVVSALVAGLYLAVVAVVEAAVGRDVTLADHVVAAVLAAAAFQPLRQVVQRSIDTVFYGDRVRPYEAMNRIGRQLEHALVPDTVLPGVVRAVSQALRVPYAAVELLADDGGWSVAAEHGRRTDHVEEFPMTYQAELVGRLLVAPRGNGQHLDQPDRQLVADLARHVGVAAHAVRATLALQRSRAELVTAREEERRRLRRELHDGLGPTLAGVTLGVHAARTQVRSAPADAEALLDTLEGQVEQAVADVRRVVYGLRPPALDEFGLLRALQLQASQLGTTAPLLTVTLDAPEAGLGKLPAAVEVAAYRIACEALTNVVRHSGATSCSVRIELNGALELAVADNGRGLPADHVAGVGVTGMRERADELGGRLSIDSDPRGTIVRARLPIAEPA